MNTVLGHLPGRIDSGNNGPSSAKRRLLAGLVCGVLGLWLGAGCAHYRIGNRTLFPQEIQTVYVPLFESSSFRRGLAERLTEAVVREIQVRTPYRVVGSSRADSVLSGKIVSDTKRVLIETPTDEARQVEMNLTVQVSWIDSRGQEVQPGLNLAVPSTLVSVGQAATLVPEAGQSITTGQQQAIDGLAQQIISLMEIPW